MAVREVADREPTCTGNCVTEVGHRSSSSLLSLCPALKRVKYPFTSGGAERELLKNPVLKLGFEPKILNTSDECSNHSATTPRMTPQWDFNPFWFRSPVLTSSCLFLYHLFPCYGEAGGLGTCELRLSMEHHERTSIIAPPRSDAVFCF